MVGKLFSVRAWYSNGFGEHSVLATRMNARHKPRWLYKMIRDEWKRYFICGASRWTRADFEAKNPAPFRWSPARNFVTESRRYDVSPRNKYASLNVFLRFYAFWLHSMTVNRDIRISIAVRSLPARFGNLWAAFWVLSFYSISILIIIVFGEFFMLGERKFLSFWGHRIHALGYK